MKAMLHASLEHIRVVVRFNSAARGLEGCGVLAQEFDEFLGLVAGFVYVLGPFDGTLRKLLRLVLDLGMKACENWENRPFEVLLSLSMRVGNTLNQSICFQLAWTIVPACVFERMFSKRPAMPPKFWSKW